MTKHAASESAESERAASLKRLVADAVRAGVGADAIRKWVEEALAAKVTPRAPSAPPRSFDREKYAAILGESKAVLEILALVDKVAASNLPVLIQGESGTGKELIARAIHQASPRKDKPFVTENCAAIPETLLESELFGYKRGAFTGADRERKGLFQTADRGTIFLDEIGDMSLAMQSKLLRALQDGEIRPVGGTANVRVDVRVVSASNRLLRDLVARHQFREDLYYRLSGVTIELPPLRERGRDVLLLARAFVAKVAAEMKREAPAIAPDAEAALLAHRWPGNVRELENEIRRCLALMRDESKIEAKHLSEELRAAIGSS
jgi:transcriptional regulator with PAS, ATPase and Fis domain